MLHLFKAACLCHTGRIRANNEDNFYFNGISLPEEHNGLTETLTAQGSFLKSRLFGIFDGMGGENNGEAASFEAANEAATMMASHIKTEASAFLTQMCHNMNVSVFKRAQALFTSHMGSTMAAVYFSDDTAHICNLGDSRIFRLRDGELTQLSHDHTDEAELKARGIDRKPRLTQHLGIDPEELLIEPYVTSCDLKRGDIYLLSSDGLTDMVTENKIAELLCDFKAPAKCAEHLVSTALQNGGRDNVTVIVCKVY